jgi:hypothetical protein
MVKMKPGEMGGAISTHGRLRTADKTFIHKSEGTILKRVLEEKEYKGVDWTHLDKDREQ